MKLAGRRARMQDLAVRTFTPTSHGALRACVWCGRLRPSRHFGDSMHDECRRALAALGAALVAAVHHATEV